MTQSKDIVERLRECVRISNSDHAVADRALLVDIIIEIRRLREWVMRAPREEDRQYVYRWRSGYGPLGMDPGPWLHEPWESNRWPASPDSRGPIQAWWPEDMRTEEYERQLPVLANISQEVRRRHNQAEWSKL